MPLLSIKRSICYLIKDMYNTENAIMKYLSVVMNHLPREVRYILQLMVGKELAATFKSHIYLSSQALSLAATNYKKSKLFLTLPNLS